MGRPLGPPPVELGLQARPLLGREAARGTQLVAVGVVGEAAARRIVQARARWPARRPRRCCCCESGSAGGRAPAPKAIRAAAASRSISSAGTGAASIAWRRAARPARRKGASVAARGSARNASDLGLQAAARHEVPVDGERDGEARGPVRGRQAAVKLAQVGRLGPDREASRGGAARRTRAAASRSDRSAAAAAGGRCWAQNASASASVAGCRRASVSVTVRRATLPSSSATTWSS